MKCIFLAPIVVAKQLCNWPIDLQTRDCASSRRVLRYYVIPVLCALYRTVWVQAIAPDQYPVLYSRSRVQTQHPDVAFPPSLSPSCHDVPAAMIIFLSWRSCCRRHHLKVVFQPSSSPSWHDDPANAILLSSSWQCCVIVIVVVTFLTSRVIVSDRLSRFSRFESTLSSARCLHICMSNMQKFSVTISYYSWQVWIITERAV